MLYDVHYQQY